MTPFNSKTQSTAFWRQKKISSPPEMCLNEAVTRLNTFKLILETSKVNPFKSLSHEAAQTFKFW